MWWISGLSEYLSNHFPENNGKTYPECKDYIKSSSYDIFAQVAIRKSFWCRRCQQESHTVSCGKQLSGGYNYKMGCHQVDFRRKLIQEIRHALYNQIALPSTLKQQVQIKHSKHKDN